MLRSHIVFYPSVAFYYFSHLFIVLLILRHSKHICVSASWKVLYIACWVCLPSQFCICFLTSSCSLTYSYSNIILFIIFPPSIDNALYCVAGLFVFVHHTIFSLLQ